MALNTPRFGKRVSLLALGGLVAGFVVGGISLTSVDASGSTPQACTSEFPASEPPRSNDVYQISEPGHLSWILQPTSETDPTIPQLAEDFQQIADIDLAGCLWSPLDGQVSEEILQKGQDPIPAVNGFTGSYDGGGFTISGLVITVDSLPGQTQDEGEASEYELFENIGFIGDLNGGTLQNLTFDQPRLSFTLGSINRATLNNLGLAVGSANGATVSDISVEEGTISLNCEVAAPTGALCDITGVGGIIGALTTSASTVDSLTSSVAISATSSDAPVDKNLEDPIILQLQPGEIDIVSIGGVIGSDKAGSTLSSLTARGSMALDFPRVNQLGGVAGSLDASRLTRAASDMQLELTHPLLLPSEGLSGGFQRIGGLVGSIISDATVEQSRSSSTLDAQLEVLHISEDLTDPQGRCADKTEGDRWVTGIETWEYSDPNRPGPRCNPAQVVAEIGGLVGVIYDPSTAGPLLSSSINRSQFTLSINESTTVSSPNPEVIIGSVGSGVGAVFQHENTQSHDVVSTSYAAGSLALTIADSLQSNAGVLTSRGLNDLAQPGSLVGSWSPDGHSVNSDTLVDSSAYTGITPRGGALTSTAQMTSTSAYENQGWPIVIGYTAFDQGRAEWGLCWGFNDGYPFLLWEYSSDPCPAPTTSSQSRDDDDSSPTAPAAIAPAAPTAATPVAPEANPVEEGDSATPSSEDQATADSEVAPQELSGPTGEQAEAGLEPEASTNLWPLALAALGGLGVLGAGAALWASSSAASASGSGVFRSK